MKKKDDEILKLILVLVIPILISLIACSKTKNVDVHDHSELTTGKMMYDHHCAACHGIKGRGKFIEGVPSNALTEKSPNKVLKKIRFGEGKKSAMPIFKTMPKDEARLIVNHLFQLKADLLNE